MNFHLSYHLGLGLNIIWVAKIQISKVRLYISLFIDFTFVQTVLQYLMYFNLFNFCTSEIQYSGALKKSFS